MRDVRDGFRLSFEAPPTAMARGNRRERDIVAEMVWLSSRLRHRSVIVQPDGVPPPGRPKPALPPIRPERPGPLARVLARVLRSNDAFPRPRA